MLMEKRDQGCIWAAHCDLYPILRATINEMEPGQPLHLLIDGSPTVWVRMDDGRDGRPTYGIRIVSGRDTWRNISLGEPCEIMLLKNTE